MSNPQHEPTMEEILASIRKIISEDATDAEPAATPAPEVEPVAVARPEPKLAVPPSPPQRQDEEDVLDLTDEVAEEPPTAMVTPPPPRTKAPEVVLHDEVVFQDEEVAVSPTSSPRREAAENGSDQGLFRAQARSAFDEALSTIEAATAAPETPVAISAAQALEGPTLAGAFEKAVREAFDPILRDWLNQNADELIRRIQPALAELLDRHLPDLLANAVREEIARSKARTGR